MRELCLPPAKAETNLPHRAQIIKMVEKKQMTAAQIAEQLGWARERTYRHLIKMDAAKLIRKVTRSNQAFFGKYIPPAIVVREPRVHAGTMTEKLSLSYMNAVVRPGSMDAYALPSRGIQA